MRVLIAEDLALLRDGLTHLLRDNGDALVHAARRDRPDIAIVDISLPPTFRDEGLRAALELRETLSEMAILVVSHYVEHAHATELLAAGGGGFGYLLKDRIMNVDEFVDAVRRVAEGGTALDAEVVAQLFSRGRMKGPLGRLTARELEVLGLMAEGRSNAAIASTLFVSTGAVEKNIASIFTKLGLQQSWEDHRPCSPCSLICNRSESASRVCAKWQRRSRGRHPGRATSLVLAHARPPAWNLPLAD